MQRTQLAPPSFCDRQTKSEWKAAAKEMKTRKWQKLKSFVICERMRWRGERRKRSRSDASWQAEQQQRSRGRERDSGRVRVTLHYSLLLQCKLNLVGEKWNPLEEPSGTCADQWGTLFIVRLPRANDFRVFDKISWENNNNKAQKQLNTTKQTNRRRRLKEKERERENSRQQTDFASLPH